MSDLIDRPDFKFRCNPILAFYSDRGPIYSVHKIIEEWDDDLWEERHDFIQWLFPTSTVSQYNPLAPVLDKHQANILESRYWSLIYDAVDRFEGFLINTNAFEKFNHNHLRISRVLQSTREIGLDKLSARFYRFVTEMHGLKYKESDGASHLQYWENASKAEKL